MFSRRECVVALIVVVCILVVIAMNQSTTISRPDETTLQTYWPTEGWRNEAPEKLGLDGPKLVAMVNWIKTSIPTIDSVIVVRHG